jgi:hypothetical protein
MAASPSVNQFGMPVAAAATNQFGLPAMSPARPAAPPPPSESGRQLAMLAGLVAVVVLATGGYLWLAAQGKKSATKVATAVEAPIVRAHQTAEIIDLQQAVQSQEAYLAEHSTYAATVADLAGFVASPTTVVTVVSATATTYCMRADDTSTFHAPSMYVSAGTAGASPTPCT